VMPAQSGIWAITDGKRQADDEIAARLDTPDRWCPSGANASTSSACPDWPINPGEDDPRVFSP
jgi:hypothetical protein